MDKKRYIAPGGWFALYYPERWSEFEDEEGSFLFYDPEKWNGNWSRRKMPGVKIF